VSCSCRLGSRRYRSVTALVLIRATITSHAFLLSLFIVILIVSTTIGSLALTYLLEYIVVDGSTRRFPAGTSINSRRVQVGDRIDKRDRHSGVGCGNGGMSARIPTWCGTCDHYLSSVELGLCVVELYQ
jgi:hypothetical protein